jgi:hypothetical protein
MKAEYGSHRELANGAKQRKEIAHMRHEEKHAKQEAEAVAPAESAEQIGSVAPTEQDKNPNRLPGLSVAQTKCFYRLREGAARWHRDVTINPQGEMSAREGGKVQSWGSIHEERNVFNKIASWYYPHLTNREQYCAVMLELFPGSTKLGFLFESKGGN